ncbi:Molybdenum ABC transporter, periplasmic molybdenum-binding protein ModA (TC 3.A.1.8.1) [hydrothermal vent metagenome]|uniref:Molybdenum ABC transporter, periplasmic molybdenum-binding protein ModA (TC 3.A.1.8.1) n=1 Tax=hydrothermal vent metagenome TaxID=652676 RepID=A0A1W1EJ01_9ZZZZ
MSANMKYPNSLYKDKIAISKPIVYAQGSLAFLSIKPRDFSKGVDILRDKNILKIAIGNPKTAPYGIVSVEALKNAKIYDDIKSKFVYGESISQTLIYTTRATDIGIVAKSSLYSPKMKQYKENINWKSIDTNLYNPINQGMVLIKDKKAKEFYDFILSNSAKKIFESYGYITF